MPRLTVCQQAAPQRDRGGKAPYLPRSRLRWCFRKLRQLFLRFVFVGVYFLFLVLASASARFAPRSWVCPPPSSVGVPFVDSGILAAGLPADGRALAHKAMEYCRCGWCARGSLWLCESRRCLWCECGNCRAERGLSCTAVSREYIFCCFCCSAFLP